MTTSAFVEICLTFVATSTAVFAAVGPQLSRRRARLLEERDRELRLRRLLGWAPNPATGDPGCPGIEQELKALRDEIRLHLSSYHGEAGK